MEFEAARATGSLFNSELRVRQGRLKFANSTCDGLTLNSELRVERTHLNPLIARKTSPPHKRLNCTYNKLTVNFKLRGFTLDSQLLGSVP